MKTNYDNIKSKEDALTAITVLWPGKSEYKDQWIAYGEFVIDMIFAFDLTQEEVFIAQQEAKNYDK